MGLSLRDQLLQAGLVTKKQVEQVNKQQHHQRREQAKKPEPIVDEQVLAAQRAADAKRARDFAANRQRQEQALQKARRAEVKQLIEQNRLPKLDTDEVFNFVVGAKIKRIPADAARREQLGSGALAIVRLDGRYEVVPLAIAERIAKRDPHAVVPRQTAAPSAPAADDSDPYKSFVVPDDLVW